MPDSRPPTPPVSPVRGGLPALGWRMLREVGRRPLWKFVWNFGFQGMRSIQRFERRRRRGQYFPAFLFVSITDRCNLSCQGCWVTPGQPTREIPFDTLDALVAECRGQGVRFFGILGGEPLLVPGLVEFFRRHPDCYFQLFTNGLLLDQQVAAQLRIAGNVTPLISIEGDELVSDQRRGGHGVLERSLQAVANCRAAGLVTGIATSVCRSNLAALASEAFVQQAATSGAHYLWYYIYRPVGPRPCPELALSGEQIRELRRFMVDIRRRAPLAIVDSYWDHLGRAMCPAALGLAPHLGPGGDLEPCPPIQFADRRLGRPGDPQAEPSLAAALSQSAFLDRFRADIPKLTRGCVIMEDPAALARLAAATGAWDSSGRGSAVAELAAIGACPSHHQAGHEIPERSWAYRFAKQHWFFGFGAYG